MKYSALICISLISILFFSCKGEATKKERKIPVRKQPKEVKYTLQSSKAWLEQNASNATNLEIVSAVNRTDKANLAKMDSIIIPSDFSGDIVYYLPFPLEVDYLTDVDKIIFFSYPSQTFAAYENGVLVYTGPTNMGRKKDQTPTGLFFTNWKAEETTSTFNDEWDLKWNFNIENKLGVGFHQYELPGYPASHSCLRLLKKDAKYLYEWADQWVLEDNENVKVKGTPVIVFGSYPFDAPKPWLQLLQNPKSLDITENEIETQTTPFLKSILANQQIRLNQ